jgi:hypothetical protein
MTAFTRAALIAEARTWIGTPWHHQAAVKGAGCDCIGFVRGAAEPFIGAITQPMNYAATWPLYRAEERLRDEMAAHATEIGHRRCLAWRHPAVRRRQRSGAPLRVPQ